MNLATRLPFDEKKITLDLIAGDRAFKPFYCIIDECANKFPNKVALQFNNNSWSYQKLLSSANKLAKLLISAGVKKGDIVGLALDRSTEMVISLLAIVKAGAAYLPLDPSYPKDRIEFMLSDSSATLLLTSKKYRGYFISDAAELLIEDAMATLDRFGPADLPVANTADDLAYVLYTSGSTGKPKGVMITHRSLSNFLLSMQKTPGISADDRLLAISTISFDISTLELYLPLTVGAEIVLVSTETARDGWLLLELIRKEQISMMQATPYTWQMLIAAGWDEFLPIKVITGGEPLSRDLAGKLLKRCAQLWNQYGPTETTVYSTQKLVTSEEDITIGHPVNRTQVYILNETLEALPTGAAGEIFIAGDGVAAGYLNRPELSAERFINDPFSSDANAKMYRTGDLGILLPNGEIQCLGRIDHQVKIRGFRIELEEIEYALLKAGGVKEAVVSVNSGTSNAPKLVAYVVQKMSADIGIRKTELAQILAGLLPAYMVPDDFVFLSAIPVTPNGKIDRKALPDPDAVKGSYHKNVVAPQTETERKLKQLWETVMGLEQVSIDDNFFALGGHSLVAVQLMARIGKLIGKRLPIATLQKYPTITELASYLDAGPDTNGGGSLVAIRPNGSKLPLYIIHGEGLNVMYFNDLAQNLDDEQPVFGLQARGLRGEAPLEIMEDIAASYVHEILSQNPDGPYFLAGYSFGGYVAVEMRKQLKAMRKEVKLIIFDTDAEKSEYKSWMYLFPRKVKRHFPRVASMAKVAVSAPLETSRLVLKKLRSKQIADNDSKDFDRQVKKIKNKLRIALRNYSIEPFDDQIYLYKAKICTHYVDDADFLGWKKYAKMGVKICEVAGDHLSMLLRPNVEDFAAKLQQGIDQLEF